MSCFSTALEPSLEPSSTTVMSPSTPSLSRVLAQARTTFPIVASSLKHGKNAETDDTAGLATSGSARSGIGGVTLAAGRGRRAHAGPSVA